MPTECSAVSDLIQRVQGRRLRTDPSDELLFLDPTHGPRPSVPPRLVEPPPAPIASATRRAYPAAPHERRTWPFVAAAVLVVAIGIAGVTYRMGVFDRDDTVPVPAAAPQIAASIAPVAPPVTNPEPAPKSWSTADGAVTAAEPSATPADPVPVAEPTQQTASKSPAPKHRRAKSKRAKHPVKNRRPASTKNPSARRIELPPPPVRAAKQRQSADDENPL